MDKNFSSYHAVLSKLSIAFSDLNKVITPIDLEQISSVIHQVMSARYRTYHSIHHVLELCEGSTSLEVLAAAFHDTIYIQVDKRIHPLLKPYTRGFSVNEETFTIALPELNELDSMDPAREVYGIFGFAPKMELGPFSGINEFLSTVVAARILFKFLSPWERLQVAAIIEATIPFRSNKPGEPSVSSLLKKRVESTARARSIDISENEIQDCIKSATKIANVDVGSFAAHDVGRFINNTWDLCLEGNPIFRNPLYLVSQYRAALQKVEGFISKLKGEVIFRSYENEPSPENFKALIERANYNLSIQVEYLQVKLIESATLESIAKLSGGDCPMTLFFGELPMEGQHHVSALDQFLDQSIPKAKDAKRNSTVMQLLRGGRSKTSYFDFKHSPIGAYFYERFSKTDLDQGISAAKQFFSAEITPLLFLKTLPKPPLDAVFHAVSETAWVRKNEIQALNKLLP